MLTLTKESQAEIEIKKSRFIAIATPANTLEEVKSIVKATWEIHPDATHVVHAAVVGKAGTMYSSSDDREPKNTAGRPALEVLKGSGITNICVCIIRYFGGTLLGTGGLVKAYGDAVKEVLKCVETEELIERISFKIVLPYDGYTLLKRILDEVKATSLSEDFATGITVRGQIPVSEKERLNSGVLDIGQGRIQIEFS